MRRGPLTQKIKFRGLSPSSGRQRSIFKDRHPRRWKKNPKPRPLKESNTANFPKRAKGGGGHKWSHQGNKQ
jgi:hypothetical protein